MRPIRVVELFAGVGSQRMALEAEGIPHEVVAIAEIDRHALASYEAIHGDCPNLGDITKVDTLPDCDLVTYSFPCQDLSLAGKRRGMGEGTRSGLVWEVMRILEAMDGRRPEWLLMENVPQVLTSPLWPDLLRRLEAMGYRNRFAKLDSSRFGSAQKRVRAFMVSRLGRSPPVIPDHEEGAPSLCIRDIMEPSVPERYVKRIPLERVKWREPPKGYANPQSDGIVCPLIDSTVPRLEDRRIAAERSLYSSSSSSSPTVCTDHGNNRIQVVDGIESRIKCVADWDNERLFEENRRIYAMDGVSPSVEAHIAKAGQGRIKILADWDRPERMDIANRIYDDDGQSPAVHTHGGGDHDIKVVADWQREGYLDLANRLYGDEGKAPSVCKYHPSVPTKVIDHIESDIGIHAFGIIDRDGNIDQTQRHRVVSSRKRRVYEDDGLAPTVLKSDGPTKVVDHMEPYDPDSDIHVFGCRDDEGNIDQNANPCRTFRDRRYYLDDGKSPACVLHTKEIPVLDHVETSDPTELVPHMEEGDVAPMLTPGREKRQSGPRYREPGDKAFTVNCQDRHGCAYPQGGDLVVRVLTPRECWRLMGFSDEDYDRAAEVSSETQLYNQAGNSIVVEVLRAIFRSMFVDVKEPPQTDLTRWLT